MIAQSMWTIYSAYIELLEGMHCIQLSCWAIFLSR